MAFQPPNFGEIKGPGPRVVLLTLPSLFGAQIINRLSEQQGLLTSKNEIQIVGCRNGSERTVWRSESDVSGREKGGKI